MLEVNIRAKAVSMGDAQEDGMWAKDKSKAFS